MLLIQLSVVMILGDRGTGKTTTIRALVDLLPEIECVADDPYNSSSVEAAVMSDEVRKRIAGGEDLPIAYRQVPMIDLPLGATEDRVCGTIDIEKALTQGKKAFEPGLLAKANRGLLYVDEVNLLMITSLTCSWILRPVVGTPWSVKASPSGTLPSSFSSAAATQRRVNSGLSCWIVSACTP